MEEYLIINGDKYDDEWKNDKKRRKRIILL